MKKANQYLYAEAYVTSIVSCDLANHKIEPRQIEMNDIIASAQYGESTVTVSVSSPIQELLIYQISDEKILDYECIREQ